MNSSHAQPWTSPLIKKGTIVREMGETTPFVFNDRLYRVENWQKYFDIPGSNPGDRFMEDEVRIRDVAADRLVSTPLTGHSFGYAFVWDRRVYVYGLRHQPGQWRVFTEIDLTTSTDLVHWSPVETVIRGEGEEHLFNVAVCRGPERFVLLYETDDKRWPAFTFKYCESPDLVAWKRIPDAVYGREKYVGGPALYFEGGWYYTLYLQDLNGYSGGTWETRVTRSRDLVHWQDAPDDRPFLAPDRSRRFTYEHFGRKVEVQEINASDAELCYFEGRTRVYFNGGDQQTCGDLQLAEFAGTPRELLETFYAEPALPRPSPRQLAYQERQSGAFVHFGMATWFDGTATAHYPECVRRPYAFDMPWWGAMVAQPPASTFNPTALDAAQWVAAAKGMGAKHIVLTAKHHNGFCLWPTATTPYCVKNSPWRHGQGDVLREFAEAARRAGLGVGFYLSAGDVSQGCFSTPEPQGQRRLVGSLEAYLPILEQQFTEVLGGYGDVCEIWLDGALDPIGPDVRRPDGTPVGTAPWDRLVALARRLQPGAVIMGGSQPDLRWPGNEEGLAPYPLWYGVEPGQEAAHWVPAGATGWIVPEADVFTRPSWFWTPDSDTALFSLARLCDVCNRSLGHGANLLINMTPDRRGLIPEAEVRRLGELGEALRRRFAAPLAAVTADAPWSEGHTLVLTLPPGSTVRECVLEEEIEAGQRVQRYRLEALCNGRWSLLCEGESVGRRRTMPLPAPVPASAVRLRILQALALPRLRLFAAY